MPPVIRRKTQRVQKTFSHNSTENNLEFEDDDFEESRNANFRKRCKIEYSNKSCKVSRRRKPVLCEVTRVPVSVITSTSSDTNSIDTTSSSNTSSCHGNNNCSTSSYFRTRQRMKCEPNSIGKRSDKLQTQNSATDSSNVFAILDEKKQKKCNSNKLEESNDVCKKSQTGDGLSKVMDSKQMIQLQSFRDSSSVQNVKTCISDKDIWPAAGWMEKSNNINLELKHRCGPCLVEQSSNLVHNLEQMMRGFYFNSRVKKSFRRPIIENFSRLKPYKMASPFDRRVTAVTWHPKHPSVVGVGSKGGEVIMWNFENAADDLFIPGVGPGGSVCAMKFDVENPNFIFTASITGRVMRQDFHGKNSKIFLDTFTWEKWFTSLDVLQSKKLIAVGDTSGCLYLLDTNGNMVGYTDISSHLYEDVIYIRQAETYRLLVTASIDNTVKLWDLRMIKDRKSALFTFPHEKAVNSAYFSLANGSSLLTTDQHSQLRVYSGPLWELEQVIAHPHRQFQHLTPIKACWHPLEDIVVVGRYPDEGFCAEDKRSIDLFDGHSGTLLFRLHNSEVPGIVS
ncbi:DNA damage-binding protein 2-like, partial [Limulus polyphemus]|uniref:DNA damage-binding protein 2 n=1 Tax=Limulus polyphemus TaxID=6850 RepID=A0ABM1BUP0_LIMPO